MSGRKVRESNINLEECCKLVRQSGAKGISAKELARKMRKDKSTIYDYLNTLELRERVQNSHGLWFSKPEQSTSDQKPTGQPLEKEIVIELPIPRNEWQRIAYIEARAKQCEDRGLSKRANNYRIILEKFNETRTIRITGKNVDDLEMDKISNLIRESTTKCSQFNLKGLFKGLKKSRPNNKK